VGNVPVSAVKNITIPVISGDGVGPELVESARLCLEAVGRATGTRFTFVECLAGYAAYSKTGDALPEETVAAMKDAPATLLGAISTKDCPSPSPMGRMRKALGYFIDIRHCLSLPGSPRPGVDLIFVRECSEGFLPDRNMYMGVGEFMPTPDVALSVRVITRQKSEQIARSAYEYARKHGRKRVTVAHKSTVFGMGCGLFSAAAREQARAFEGIEITEETPDNLARSLVIAPEKYDIILTTNLFGDILSEVAGAHVGDLVPILNASDETALLYPGHGPLKQLAGKNRVNPMGMLYTASMLLHWLDLRDEAGILDRALASCNNAAPGSSSMLPAGTTTCDVVRAVANSI
jgi:3-isopropylmalate dehydrogenase